MVLSSQRLDMQALAAELGVNRVTLYRWVGTREQLLVEVLWSMTQWRFDEIWGEVIEQPGSRVPEALRRWVKITVDSPGIRYLLYDQNDLAMRLLTLESGGFQPRLLALIRRLIEQDITDGRVASPLDLDELAFAVLRICESYIYLPVILKHETDPDAMMRVLQVLLPTADGLPSSAPKDAPTTRETG
jgi:AcrR family transcriptional regulator